MTSIRTRFDTKRLEARLTGLGKQDGMKAIVGVVPRDADLRYENGATVADVARWLTNGTPNMAARPYQQRARQAAVPKLRKIIREELKAGKPPVEALGKAAGEMANALVREIDTAAAWAEPLADSTVKKKGHRKPLSDTHLLREVQSWEIQQGGQVIARGRPAR